MEIKALHSDSSKGVSEELSSKDKAARLAEWCCLNLVL
jgi:hypothetical protein